MSASVDQRRTWSASGERRIRLAGDGPERDGPPGRALGSDRLEVTSKPGRTAARIAVQSTQMQAQPPRGRAHTVCGHAVGTDGLRAPSIRSTGPRTVQLPSDRTSTLRMLGQRRR